MFKSRFILLIVALSLLSLKSFASVSRDFLDSVEERPGYSALASVLNNYKPVLKNTPPKDKAIRNKQNAKNIHDRLKSLTPEKLHSILAINAKFNESDNKSQVMNSIAYAAQQLLEQKKETLSKEEKESIDAIKGFKDAFDEVMAEGSEQAEESNEEAAPEQEDSEEEAKKEGKHGENPAADDIDGADTSKDKGAPIANSREIADKRAQARSEWIKKAGLSDEDGGALSEALDNLETSGDTEEAVQKRWKAAKDLLGMDKLWEGDNPSGELGLKDSGKKLFDSLYQARKEKDIEKLRNTAHDGEGADKRAARLEVARRLDNDNLTSKWAKDAFKSIRPELLLKYGEDIKGEDSEAAASALGDVIGTLNSKELEALSAKAKKWQGLAEKKKDDELKRFATRLNCAAQIATNVRKGKDGVSPEGCDDEVSKAFGDNYKEVIERNKKFHEFIDKAKTGDEGIEAARKWLFEDGKYNRENIMDYLGQRLDTCDNLTGKEAEEACKDAAALAKILGWKDDNGNWNLNLKTKDVRTNVKDKREHVLNLGKGENIGETLKAFNDRDAGRDPANDPIVGETGSDRSRFQSYEQVDSHTADGKDDIGDKIKEHVTNSDPLMMNTDKKIIAGVPPKVPAAKPAEKEETEPQSSSAEKPTEPNAQEQKTELKTNPDIELSADQTTEALLNDSGKCASCHSEDGGKLATIADFDNLKVRLAKGKEGAAKKLERMIKKTAEDAGDELTEAEKKAIRFYALGSAQ